MPESRPKFFVGQLVHHTRFEYRGVVVDVDPIYLGTDAWYDQVARSRPPRDKPWYRVLVHDDERATYVAERHLEPDQSGDPVRHPAINDFFVGFTDGVYVRPHH
jgi:heat shock protein HspQ